jgi:hypothetical protein
MKIEKTILVKPRQPPVQRVFLYVLLPPKLYHVYKADLQRIGQFQMNISRR